MTHKSKIIVIASLVLALSALVASHHALADSGTITATPNAGTCGSFQTSGGSQSCSVVIGWSTPAAQYDVVKESINGGAAFLFSCSQGSFTEPAANYSAGSTYTFTLYSATTATNCNNGVTSINLNSVTFTPSAGSIANCDATAPVIPNPGNSHTMTSSSVYQVKVTCNNNYLDTWSQALNYKLVMVSAANTPTSLWTT